MAAVETIRQYYERTKRLLPPDLADMDVPVAHFNVLRRGNCYASLQFVRRDYYKICLCRGRAELFTEAGAVTINRPAIFFSDTEIRYGWQNRSAEQAGYVCLFNEPFATPDLRHAFRRFTGLFNRAGHPFLFLDEESYTHFAGYFESLISEYRDDFVYREEVIRNILKLIIYTAIKMMRTSGGTAAEADAKDVVVTRFLNLLDGQFPLDSPTEMLGLRSPADFAKALHIHVNHLNHCVKESLGKTTSELIHGRVLKEATDLLRQSDWPVAAIGYCLGFAYPQHFNAFFRKHTGASPKAYRNRVTDL
ncbi:MAG: AraC family transcriptional regulator [Parapedobacter sp.]|nr:MAG: AraC family transcriptional regulator [Parapedobacter sp.]